jgi:hypothetical protein
MKATLANPSVPPVEASPSGSGRRSLTALLICAALLCTLSVWLINGIGLVYFDTDGYIRSGEKVLRVAGIELPPVAPVATDAPQAEAQTEAQAAPQSPAQNGTPDDKRTLGSRSALYGVVLALAALAGSPDIVVALSLGTVWLAAWLVARVVARAWSLSAGSAQVAATLLLAGCLGSLPFYVAFLMPDILAPVLILMIAITSAFFHRMLVWERTLCGLLALAAVLAHPSHLVMAVLLVPFGLLLAPMERRSRILLGLLLVGLVLGAGVAERVLFSRVVERVQGGEVIYFPFLTARLIDDGPGMEFLSKHCPDPAWEGCALHDLLVQPGDPLRFDAPILLFTTKPPYATYRTLPIPVQNAIAAEQIRFAMAVAMDQPLSVAGQVLANIADQIRRSGSGMTIPTPGDLAFYVTPDSRLFPHYAEGRLTGPDRGWIATVTTVHTLVYAASALAILVLLALPRPEGRPVLRLVSIILLGILINAVVCGVVSEPADRYGARVMMLLPMTVALLLWARLGGGRGPA